MADRGYPVLPYFPCGDFGGFYIVVFIWPKLTRIHQESFCCNLFQVVLLRWLGYMYILISPFRACIAGLTSGLFISQIMSRSFSVLSARFLDCYLSRSPCQNWELETYSFIVKRQHKCEIRLRLRSSNQFSPDLITSFWFSFEKVSEKLTSSF